MLKKQGILTVTAEPKMDSNSSFLGALCYLPAFIFGPGISLFILLSKYRHNRFLVFHAYQALFLSVFIFLYSSLYLMSGLTPRLFVGLDPAIYILADLVSLLLLPGFVVLILALLAGLFKAFIGEKYSLPVIGKYAQKLAFF